MKNRKLLIVLAVLTAISMTGCSKSDSELAIVQAKSKEPIRSLQKVMDTNAESMKYSSFSQRTAVKDYKANYNVVSETQANKCYTMLTDVLTELNKNIGYNIEIVDKQNHDYLKNILDDVILENPRAQSLKEFSGYYFLTVEFTTKPNTLGNFLSAGNYVGLDNCFKHTETGDAELNDSWISEAIKQLNISREAKGETPYQVFLSINSNEVYNRPEETTPVDDIGTNDVGETGETGETGDMPTGDGGENGTDGMETQPETQPEIQNDITNNTTDVYIPANKAIGDSDTYNENLRKLEYSISEYENILGTSLNTVSFMPDLSMIYQSTTPVGALSGDGCYNEGISGLRDFGFDRDELNTYTYKTSKGETDVNCSGLAHVTFVFKQDELDKEALNFVFAYLEDYKSNNSFIEKYDTQNYVTVPEFVENQIKIKIEEFDRLTNNGDANGLLRMDTIEDAGLGFRQAQYRNVADITTYSTEYKGVLERKGNVYLVALERTVADSPKDLGYVGQYKEKGFAVVRQKDLDFYINDIFLASKELTKQPTVYEISQQYRQLVNLNLADEVSEEIKAAITSTVLNDWAYYSNKRILYSKNQDVEGYGMYEQFNDNRATLSDDTLEYINSKMRGYLVAKGTSEQSTLFIKPVTWIDGTEEQVELVTKEFINYPSFKEGKYLECYYLLSHFGNRWVIDDIQVFNERNVSGEDYNLLIQDFSSADVIKGERASSDTITDVTGTVNTETQAPTTEATE